MKLKVAKLNNQPEIFYTIQGEGVNIGVPSIFIRLSLCNLYCVWCDTDYTWNWEGTSFKHLNNKKYKKEEQIIVMEVDEVIQFIKQWNCKQIVLTGGEPMLQQRLLTKLMQNLKPDGYYFEIETNATMRIDPEFDALIDQYNCSPKIASSGNEKGMRETRYFVQYVASSKATFKYVIVTPDDLEEVLLLIDKYKIPKERIILMPEGRTPEELKEKSTWLVEIAKEKGFRFTPRLHINIWGTKRGV